MLQISQLRSYFLLLSVVLLGSLPAFSQSVPRRSPHNGEFSIEDDFAESYFSWLNVGGWTGSDPKFELDFTVHKDLFGECISMSDLPDFYDDCATAGVAEEGDVKVFSVGSHHAKNIVSNRRYHAEWMFTGGTIAVSEYSIGWQELENRLCPFIPNPDPHLCYFSVAGNTLMKYILSRSLPDERWWKWRDNTLASTGSFRLEPDGAYWSGRAGRHSGTLLGPSGQNFDLYLQKWENGNWVTVASSTSPGPNEPPSSAWVEYSGPAGYYAWKVISVSGTGNYQFGSAGPMGGASPPLSVTLSASPAGGNAPLNDVSLTATLGDTAPWTTNYTFYCNRTDNGTNITPNPAAKFNDLSQASKTALNVCDYGSPGTYTAKVIAERGSSAAEARTTITVTQATSQAPSVTTSGSSSVTQESATLSLSVNPKGSNTSVWFDWGSGTSFCCSTGQQVVTASAGTSLLSMTVGSLTCNTTYSFRARAQNAGGSATGDALSFKTGACGSGPQTVQLVADPSFEGGNNAWWVASPSFFINHGTNFPNPHTGTYYAALATSQGDPGNNLQGGVISPQVTIPSNATSAELRFWYRISTSETTTTASDTFSFYLVKPGNQQTSVASYSNLDSTGTSYRERVIAVPSSFFGIPIQLFFAGFTNGSLPTVFRVDDVTLSAVLSPTGSAPSVSTGTADQIQATSARLNMTANANGASTSVWFNLEAGDSTPDDETEHIAIGNGTQSSSVSISAFGLQCGTLYYFRARATNSFDSSSGTVKSFTTAACGGGSPRADTDPALNVTQTSATLTADVNPNGLPAQAWFAWGPSTSLGQETTHVSVGSGVGFVNFSQTLSGLICGTDYYFANHVSNSVGQDTGSTGSFTTLPCEGGGSSAQGFSLDFRRQGCSGNEPAILLWWTAPAGMSNVFTVRRSDGGYTATVDVSQGGMTHLVSGALVPGATYSFSVEGTLDGAAVQTNAVTVPILSDECRLPVGVGELPHLPLLWAGPAVCSGSKASVPVYWTAVGGATSYTLTRIDNVAAQLTPYPNLTGTSLVDSGLVPGAEYEYMLDAVGTGGSRRTSIISVFVPSGICAEPSIPGPFSAQVSTPVCTAGKGAVTVSWTAASGAKSRVTTYWSDDGFASGTTSTSTLSSVSIDGIRPGALAKFMTQAESASTPLQYRSVIMSQRIPLDICGSSSTLPPTVTTSTPTYIQERQALLRASIIPNADTAVAFFEWGTTTSYGSTTPLRNTGDGYRSVSLGEVLTGLACGTTYYYRAVASNAVGTTRGIDGTFTTASCSTTLPVVTITATDPTATENPMTTGTFLIERTGSTAAELPVTYAVGGTATVGVDHTLGAGTVTIPAGSASRTLTVFPLDDTLAESDETVIVTLQPQSQYTVGIPSSATVSIASDEISNLIFSDGFETGDLSQWLTSAVVVTPLTQGQPGRPGKDIWTTSYYSYTPVQGTPGGGLDDDRLRVGGWGDSYFSLIEFDLSGLPQQARAAHIELYPVPHDGAARATDLYLDRITAFWDWRTQGTGSDRERLWWVDRPAAVQWRSGTLPAPTPNQWYSIDITDLYNAWQAGTYPNYGIQLRPVSTDNAWAEFYSANAADQTLRPRLVVDPASPTQVHFMVGVWKDTIAGYTSTLTIAQDTPGNFSAQVSMDQANDPVEQLTVGSVTDMAFVAYRPADHNAELRLSLVQSGGHQCLTGSYIENGGYRPISLCKGQ